MTNNTNIAVTLPTNIVVTFKTLGVRVGTDRATKKLREDEVIREVGPAIRRWCWENIDLS